MAKKSEERYTYGAAARRRKKNRRKYTFYYFIAAVLMLAVGAALALTVFFNITDITVINESRYSDDEIIEAGGVVIGDNLLRLRSSEVKAGIIKEFPYIESVKLHRVFPTELQLEVSEAAVAAAIEHDERYLLISANGRVLEEISANPEGSPRIVGPDIKKLEAGDYLPEKESERLSALIEMLDEERLQYVGSMVLGLNDALVELTGTLAGLTFALQNNRLVALSGLITGVSATFSMTASSYLSAKSEGDPNAVKSCAYTGIMYLITVVFLAAPYLLFPAAAALPALITMLLIVALIILGFNYYISVAKSLNFKQRFMEMFIISGSVAVLSFVVGLLVKAWLGIDV